MSDEIVKIDDITWDQVVNSFGGDINQLSEKDAEACSYLVSGYSIPEAAREVGITPKTLRTHIKENPLMQKVIQQKARLVQEFLLNEFRRQMRVAIERSKDYLEMDPQYVNLTRDQMGLLKDQVSHSRWIIDRFGKMLEANPLEGLSISNQGDGTLNVQFNVNTENNEALDYIATQMKEEQDLRNTGGEAPRLNEAGEPPHGEFGIIDITEEGNWICHICGEGYVPGRSFFSHLSGKHKMSKEQYEDFYDVDLG